LSKQSKQKSGTYLIRAPAWKRDHGGGHYHWPIRALDKWAM